MRQDPVPGSGNDFVSHQSISLVSETDTGGNGCLDGGHITDYLDHRPARTVGFFEAHQRDGGGFRHDVRATDG